MEAVLELIAKEAFYQIERICHCCNTTSILPPGGEQGLTEKPPERVPSTRSNIPSNTVLIGQKELMAYCTAIVMQLNSGIKELSVKARGRVISKAVDVVEVCRRRFFEGKLEITGVNIGTEVLGEEGQTRNVSTIEIKLRKKD
ncbi:MAG TPA: DNA-binding protein Alba [Terriglobales bacterium]|nr:DNA-binding protein Alba [Terriglobales bacterium]